MTSADPSSARSRTISTGCVLPVGLFGEQTKTTSGRCAKTSATSCVRIRHGSSSDVRTSSLFVTQTSRECIAYVGSNRTTRRAGPAYAWRSCRRISFEPFATQVPSSMWPFSSARRERSSSASRSG
jgi:hypothetical protein